MDASGQYYASALAIPAASKGRVLQREGIGWRIYQDMNDNWIGAMNGCLALHLPELPDVSNWQNSDAAQRLLPKAVAPATPEPLFQESGMRYARMLP